MTKVAVSGSFNRFHKGHRALIDKAFEVGDEIFIGITTDAFASTKNVALRPFDERKNDVEDYVKNKGKPYTFMTVTNALEIEKMREMDTLVVSEETRKNGVEIVEILKKEGKDLELVTIPLVRSRTGEKISSTDIVNGLYDKEGHRKKRFSVQLVQ